MREVRQEERRKDGRSEATTVYYYGAITERSAATVTCPYLSLKRTYSYAPPVYYYGTTTNNNILLVTSLIIARRRARTPPLSSLATLPPRGSATSLLGACSTSTRSLALTASP